MKLGSETGSLVNHLYSQVNTNNVAIEVGMGATVLVWSDRRAATVTSIDKNIITVQEDTATRIDNNGMSEIQDYQYDRNQNGMTYNFRVKKDGSIEHVTKNATTGRWNKSGGSGLLLGKRMQYRDFSF